MSIINRVSNGWDAIEQSPRVQKFSRMFIGMNLVRYGFAKACRYQDKGSYMSKVYQTALTMFAMISALAIAVISGGSVPVALFIGYGGTSTSTLFIDMDRGKDRKAHEKAQRQLRESTAARMTMHNAIAARGDRIV